jgi:hypothetical protein
MAGTSRPRPVVPIKPTPQKQVPQQPDDPPRPRLPQPFPGGMVPLGPSEGPEGCL